MIGPLTGKGDGAVQKSIVIFGAPIYGHTTQRHTQHNITQQNITQHNVTHNTTSHNTTHNQTSHITETSQNNREARRLDLQAWLQNYDTMPLKGFVYKLVDVMKAD